jgi:predicted RNA-binding Zn ribbon-like protein
VNERIRQTLLNKGRNQRTSETSLHLFTELVGIQSLLMNALSGERVTAKQLDALLRQVQSARARKQQELRVFSASLRNPDTKSEQ